MTTLRECYEQAKANAAIDDLSPPQETAALREKWLSGQITFDDYLMKLRDHYREEPCGLDEELSVPNLLGIRDPAKLRAAEYDFSVAREVELTFRWFGQTDGL